MQDGLDSAYSPSLTIVQTARSQGYVWWGYYLPALPNTDPLNGWNITQVQNVRTGGMAPVPICVPAPPHPADPVVTATEYFNLAKQYGHNIKVPICYNGEHIAVTGPVWLPVPGAKPTAVGPQSALQWGSGTILGLGVDYNVSADDFPMNTGLVFDLEHNASYTTAWYETVQQTIATLAASAPPPPPPPPTPEGGYVFRQIGVEIVGGHGWTQLPAPVSENDVINVIAETTDPPVVGNYQLPTGWDWAITNDGTNRVVFNCPGLPNGAYGFRLVSTV